MDCTLGFDKLLSESGLFGISILKNSDRNSEHPDLNHGNTSIGGSIDIASFFDESMSVCVGKDVLDSASLTAAFSIAVDDFLRRDHRHRPSILPGNVESVIQSS